MKPSELTVGDSITYNGYGRSIRYTRSEGQVDFVIDIPDVYTHEFSTPVEDADIIWENFLEADSNWVLEK